MRSELAPVALFIGCVASAAAAVPAAQHGALAAMLAAVAGIVAFGAGLVAWVLLADRRARRRDLGSHTHAFADSWHEFERKFWNHVAHRSSGSREHEQAED